MSYIFLTAIYILRGWQNFTVLMNKELLEKCCYLDEYWIEFKIIQRKTVMYKMSSMIIKNDVCKNSHKIII